MTRPLDAIDSEDRDSDAMYGEGAYDSEAGYGEGAYDSEAGYGEGAYDSEAGYGEGAYDSEDARSDAARRARARRLAVERQRLTAARRARPSRPTVQVPATPRQTIAAIRELDLQTRVSTDSLQQMIERANRRANRATYATVAALAVDQALDSFGSDLADHDFVRAGLRSAPLLLLSPERKRRGLEGFITDPRVIGVAGVVALVTAGKLSHRGDGVASISVLPLTVAPNGRAGRDGQFTGLAVDKHGADLNVPVTFRSSNTSILTVDLDGSYTVQEAGSVFVVATAGGRSQPFAVTVTVPA